MKILAGVLSLCLSLSCAPLATAAQKDSKLSAFKGFYTGFVVYSGFASGKTTASFTAKAKKEVGKITLQSAINLGEGSKVLTESISLNGKRSIFTFDLDQSSFRTRGTAKISKNKIRYTAKFISDGTTYTVQGVGVLKGKKFTLVETFTSNVANFTISYDLKRK